MARNTANSSRADATTPVSMMQDTVMQGEEPHEDNPFTADDAEHGTTAGDATGSMDEGDDEEGSDVDPTEKAFDHLELCNTFLDPPTSAYDPQPVLRAMATTTPADQLQDVEDMFAFITEPSATLRDLNDDRRCIPFLTALPNHQIRILWGLGIFTGGFRR
mmetsp:Transcript_16797/g.24491  ORF Transcript_16797/g.24491 Transcript_16797/m.24491 type:complete len:161 (-) Transcript_16797:156-638(-)